MSEDKLVIVTGFGPFIGHELINASWEAVRLLPDNMNYDNTIYKIEKILVPVEYDKVDKVVKEIWDKNPELVIHCGVHGDAKCLHLEKFACNNKFCRPDYSGKYLECSKAHLENNENCEKLSTNFDLKEIIKVINNSSDIKVCESIKVKNNSDKLLLCSLDVGSYLCGYIYIKSLDKNNERCLFIHVPPINKPFTSNETSELIYEVIKQCLEQLNKNV